MLPLPARAAKPLLAMSGAASTVRDRRRLARGVCSAAKNNVEWWVLPARTCASCEGMTQFQNEKMNSDNLALFLYSDFAVLARLVIWKVREVTAG